MEPELRLDAQGVLVACHSCGSTNRLKFATLDRRPRCGKCRADLPFPSAPIEATSTAVFDAAVASAPVPIVVDFWASWCAPCRMMAPELEKVAQRTAGRALVLKVDTDQNPELADRYTIRSIPTIMVFQGGRDVARQAGVQPAAAVEDMLARHARAS